MSLKFQSTPPRRERPVKKLDLQLMIYFNPRPREGSDFSRTITEKRLKNFNPRPREGSDSLTNNFIIGSVIFQSTPPRRERRNTFFNNVSHSNISIHAPAKGATRRSVQKSISSWKFQSTPPRRERHAVISNGRYKSIFQSTPPRRERLSRHKVRELDAKISIHAPAKGATVEASKYKVLYEISIHAPAKGATSFDGRPEKL